MIKSFSKFTEKKSVIGSGSAFVTATTDAQTGAPVEKGFRIDIFEADGATSGTDYDATIYVMPDETVEIRTVGGESYVHGIVLNLDGEEVRSEGLYRCEWTLRVK